MTGVLMGLVAPVVAAMATGAILHELTHALVAHLLGASSVRVDWLTLDVVYQMPGDEPRWKDRVINLSPQLVGLAVATAYFATVGVQPRTFEGLVLGLGWGVYTLMGGLNDFSLRLAEGKRWWWQRQPKHKRTAILGSFTVYAGAALMVLRPTIFVQNLAYWGGYALLVAGSVVIGLSVWQSTRQSSEDSAESPASAGA